MADQDFLRRAAMFFAFARKRHHIYIKRSEGQPWPWTDDPILGHYRFTNIYRELDATTVALRKLTDQMPHSPDVLLLTVALRWLNRRESWDVMMRDTTVRKLAADLRNESELRRLHSNLVTEIPGGPWVTGAYIIKTPNGMDKLSGVFECIRNYVGGAATFTSPGHGPVVMGDYAMALHMLSHRGSIRMEDVWTWLCQFAHQGQFTAYEVVSDLRHTGLLDKAPDIMTWANAGPGAMRGLNRVHNRDLFFARRSHPWVDEIRRMLELSQSTMYWPQGDERWPAWEMREAEHTLCEFDKYERARLGEGRPRGTYP